MTDPDTRLVAAIEEQLQSYFALYVALREDCDHWWLALQQEYQDAFLRRSSVRATFALIEGVLHGLKGIALEMNRVQPALTDGEVVVLRGESYSLDDKGVAMGRKLRLKLSSDLRFTFGCMGRLMKHTEALIDSQGTDWEGFRRALEVRHRLMHPKTVADLTVQDDEIRETNRAYNWFHERLQALFRKALAPQPPANIVPFRR